MKAKNWVEIQPENSQTFWIPEGVHLELDWFSHHVVADTWIFFIVSTHQPTPHRVWTVFGKWTYQLDGHHLGSPQTWPSKKQKNKTKIKQKTKKSEVLAKQQLLLTAEWYAVETKADVFLQLFHSMTSVDSDASYFLTLLQQDRSPDHNPLMPRPFPIFLSLLILLSVNN